MVRWTVATVTGLGALAVFGAAASPAGALTPTRTAWWNEAPLGLLVTASPVQANQLVVAEGTTGPNAVSAVYYSVAGAPGVGQALLSVSATLKLAIDSGSSTGTPAVTACPVDPSSPSWQGGGDQTGKPPTADCSNGKGVAGQVAADGTSVSFSLTPAQQKTGSPGVFDLVLIPSSQTPFQTVFDPPGNEAFSVNQPAPPTGAAAQGTQGAPDSSGSSPAPGTDQGSGSPAGPGPSGGPSPDLSGGDLSSVPALGAPSAPSVPSAGAASTASGPAGSAGGSTRVAAGALRPTASSASPANGSGGLFGGRREQLFGVWLLVDAGLVLFLFGSDLERAPRLLGSMAARRSGAQVPEAEQAAPVEVRGIGRFARPRSEPPRRLY